VILHDDDDDDDNNNSNNNNNIRVQFVISFYIPFAQWAIIIIIIIT